MISAKTGLSHGSDTYTVAIEAAAAAYDPAQNLLAIIVFNSVAYNPEIMIQGIQSVVGTEVPIVGASTAGEITEQGPVKTNSIALMAVYGTDVTVHTAIGTDIASDPHQAGAAMASSLKSQVPGDELKFVILFDDVLTGNGADIVRGVQSVLGKTFPIAGGAAGDDFEFSKTFQYYNGEVHESSVVGIAFTGNISFGVGVRHGWIPVGLPLTVTKAEGAVVYEIDNKPAVEVYRDYFGAEVANELQTETLAKTSITYPFGIPLSGTKEYLIRDPLSVDESGAITCAAEIPEGSEIRLMLGSKEEAIEHAKIAATEAKERLGTDPKAIIIFNCIARNKLFAQDNKKEITAIQSILGNIPLLGFYTYGEQAPIFSETKHFESCEASFHNETIVIVTLG